MEDAFDFVWLNANRLYMWSMELLGSLTGMVSDTVGNFFHRQANKTAVDLHAYVAAGAGSKDTRKSILRSVKKQMNKKGFEIMKNSEEFEKRLVTKLSGGKAKFKVRHLKNKEVAERWLRAYQFQSIKKEEGILDALTFSVASSDAWSQGRKVANKVEKKYRKILASDAAKTAFEERARLERENRELEESIKGARKRIKELESNAHEASEALKGEDDVVVGEAPQDDSVVDEDTEEVLDEVVREEDDIEEAVTA